MGKLVINSGSWHYRVYRYVRSKTDVDYLHYSDHSSDPKTLCSYFWSWNWNVGQFLLLCLVGCALCTLAVVAIPGLLWSYFHNHSQSAGIVLVFIAGVTFLVLFCYGLGKARRWFNNYLYYHNRNIPEGSKEGLSGTAVVFQMIKATKEKVCPFIEYK